MKKDTKWLILSFTGLIVMAILANGFTIGTFHKTSNTMDNVWWLCYLVSATAIFLFFLRKKLFSNLTPLQKVGYSTALLLLSLCPSIILEGAIGYVDYYTTNKQWKAVEVSVKNRHGNNGKGSEFTYELVNRDTVLYLDCKIYYKDFETFTLNICTTNLGNVVAYKKYQ